MKKAESLQDFLTSDKVYLRADEEKCCGSFRD